MAPWPPSDRERIRAVEAIVAALAKQVEELTERLNRLGLQPQKEPS